FAVLRLGLRLELSPEYDSNVDRVEEGPPLVVSAADGSRQQVTVDVPPPVGSFLLRTTARGTLSLTSGRNALRLSLDLGGKWFFSSAARQQDQVVLRTALDVHRRFGEHTTLGLTGDYWDN